MLSFSYSRLGVVSSPSEARRERGRAFDLYKNVFLFFLQVFIAEASNTKVCSHRHNIERRDAHDDHTLRGSTLMRGLGLGLSAVVLCGARTVLLAEARKNMITQCRFARLYSFANDFGPKLAASDCNRSSLSVMRSTHLRRAAQHIHGCRNTNGRKMECRVNAVQAMLRSREKRGFRLSSCSSALEPSYTKYFRLASPDNHEKKLAGQTRTQKLRRLSFTLPFFLSTSKHSTHSISLEASAVAVLWLRYAVGVLCPHSKPEGSVSTTQYAVVQPGVARTYLLVVHKPRSRLPLAREARCDPSYSKHGSGMRPT